MQDPIRGRALGYEVAAGVTHLRLADGRPTSPGDDPRLRPDFPFREGPEVVDRPLRGGEGLVLIHEADEGHGRIDSSEDGAAVGRAQGVGGFPFLPDQIRRPGKRVL